MSTNEPKKQADLDNRSRQLNPEHEAWHKSRGEDVPVPEEATTPKPAAPRASATGGK